MKVDVSVQQHTRLNVVAEVQLQERGWQQTSTDGHPQLVVLLHTYTIDVQ